MISAVDKIDPSNLALKYIKKRILDPDYRGNVGSQHNRWDMDEAILILTAIDKYSGGARLKIRTADMSKRPMNTPAEAAYADFCNFVKTKAGKGTQDSIRKNLFPDFHRAGWIHRFDSVGVSIAPYDSRGVDSVSLSPQGLKIISAEKLDSKYFLFSKGVDTFLSGIISKLLHLLSDIDHDLGYIDLLELTFFVSAVGVASPSINISLTECRDLILEWRKMSKMQRIGVDSHLKKELVKNEKITSKVDQRDYHNWLNASQQGFHLLKQTIYFEEREDKVNPSFSRLYWMQKTGGPLTDSEKEAAAKVRLSRSLAEKHAYFKQHGVIKQKGFELHHVVALAWAESEHHFKILDSWKNMVYIDGFNHAKITQNRNLNVKMEINSSDIFLKDYSGNTIEFFYPTNIIWDSKHSKVLSDYNEELLGFVAVI
jgi:hypothetical protein